MGSPNAGLFTSTTDEWPTPQVFFDALHAEFSFSLDVCATADNAKVPHYFSRAEDGLAQSWDGVCWMNPPYGREIRLWVAKAYEESRRGATVVCLIPARTDTRYWHDYVMRAAEVRLIAGRLHFHSPRHEERKASGEAVAHNAPFPSAVVVFRPDITGPPVLKAIDRSGIAMGDSGNCGRCGHNVGKHYADLQGHVRCAQGCHCCTDCQGELTTGGGA